MRNRVLKALLIPAAALLTACSSQGPNLTLTEAYVGDRSDAGTLVYVVVKAENPTPSPLAMWAIAYTAGGEGAVGGNISRWTQATAPPGGSVSFDLPVVIAGPASGASTVSIAGKVAYVPGGRFRELLNELDVPLPTTGFNGTMPIDLAAAPRPVAVLRPATVRTATVTDRGPVKAVDTLPPLK